MMGEDPHRQVVSDAARSGDSLGRGDGGYRGRRRAPAGLRRTGGGRGGWCGRGRRGGTGTSSGGGLPGAPVDPIVPPSRAAAAGSRGRHPGGCAAGRCTESGGGTQACEPADLPARAGPVTRPSALDSGRCSAPSSLVGSGEFTAAMEAIDRDLLAATAPARPRVAILPTASWPDGEETFLGWIERGRAHFAALGAEVEGVEIRAREAAFDEACARRSARPTSSTSRAASRATCSTSSLGTPAAAALRAVRDRGGVLAGSSAGAMALAACQPRVGRPPLLPVPHRLARCAWLRGRTRPCCPTTTPSPSRSPPRSPSPRRAGWPCSGSTRTRRRSAGRAPGRCRARPGDGLARPLPHALSGRGQLPARRPGGRAGAGRRRGGLTVPTAPGTGQPRRSRSARSPGAVGCRRVSRP